MSYTRAEIINRALKRLNVIAEGQSVAAEDVAKVDALVDAAFAELAALDIYYVQDAGSIGPTDGSFGEAEFLPLADYLAWRSCDEFPSAADERMQVVKLEAIRTLRKIAAPPRNRRYLSVDPAVRPYRRIPWPSSS